MRRTRIDRRGVERAVHLFGNPDFQIDRADRSMARFIALAENHGLTAYDATYLELAEREGVRLASSDGNLIAVAKAAKIALIWSSSRKPQTSAQIALIQSSL